MKLNTIVYCKQQLKMSLSRYISPNSSLWRSILRIAKDPLIATNADSIPINPYSLYSSNNITNTSNITDDINEEDIENTDKFYKKGEMSFWCDN